MKHHRVPMMKCPRCNHELDAATNPMRDGAPEPGHFTVCLYCTSILIFGERLALRPAAPEDMEKLTPQEASRVAKCVTVAAMVKASR